MKKLSNAQTLISIGNKEFLLREMSIGRAREFGVKVVRIVDEFKKKRGKKITKMEVEDVLNQYGDLAFDRLTEMFNWIFSYKDPDYKPTERKFFEDNLSIREITEITKEVARQNQLEWLTNFFQENFKNALKVMKS